MELKGDKNVEQMYESISVVQPADKLCSGFSSQQSNSCYEGTLSYSDELCNTNVDVDDNASIINKVIINGRLKCSLHCHKSNLFFFQKTVCFHWFTEKL